MVLQALHDRTRGGRGRPVCLPCLTNETTRIGTVLRLPPRSVDYLVEPLPPFALSPSKGCPEWFSSSPRSDSRSCHRQSNDPSRVPRSQRREPLQVPSRIPDIHPMPAIIQRKDYGPSRAENLRSKCGHGQKLPSIGSETLTNVSADKVILCKSQVIAMPPISLFGA